MLSKRVLHTQCYNKHIDSRYTHSCILNYNSLYLTENAASRNDLTEYGDKWKHCPGNPKCRSYIALCNRTGPCGTLVGGSKKKCKLICEANNQTRPETTSMWHKTTFMLPETTTTLPETIPMLSETTTTEHETTTEMKGKPFGC